LSPGSSDSALDYDAPYTLSAGAARHRAANNNNVLPLDRIYYTFDYSQSALYDAQNNSRSIDLRYSTFGLEKSLLDGAASAEVRLPWITGYNDEQGGNLDLPAITDAELGNAYFAFKFFLHSNSNSVLTAGMGVTLPTASDANYLLGGSPIYTIKNHAVYLQPYVAYAAQLSRRSFFQLWAQGDFASEPNDVFITTVIAGEYQEQDLFMLDLQTGYWFYESPCSQMLQGIAGISELHYTTTLSDTDIRPITRLMMNPQNRMDVLNLTLGTHLQLTPRANARFAVTAPLRSGDNDTNQFYDLQFIAQFDILSR
jgi:hypothetical protein